MNSEFEPKFVSPSIVWPSIIVVVIGLYGYLTYKPKLTSARPGTSVTNETRMPPGHSAYARLWQDPLGPEYADVAKRVYGASSDCPPRVRKQLDEVVDDLPSPLLVLPVFLAGGPSVDDRELRRRTRYATLAALTTLHYRPKFSDRLHFLTLPAENSSLRSLVVPFEPFVPSLVDSIYDDREEANFQTVLVCWLDESRIERPAHQVHYLLRSFFPPDIENPEKIKVRVLGPTNSDSLFAMAKENSNFSIGEEQFTTFHEPVTVYSPRATVADRRLKHSPSDDLKRLFTRPCAVHRVIRTIGTDVHLADALRHELKLRRAWPVGDDDCIVLVTERDTLYGRAFPKMFASLLHKDARQRQKRVRLRKEIRGLLRKSPSSSFSRKIATALQSNNDDLVRSIEEKLEEEEKTTDLHGDVEAIIDRPARQAKDQLLVFKFLRGMDGLLASDSSNKPDGDTKNASGKRTVSPERSIQPVGRGQYDYLERLEEQLVEVDNQRRRRGGPGIRAIGVVGTDVYDKLLVLRALRNRFPRTSFFTTDLDENFSRRTEADSSRNLLVASHFALTLCADLQRDAPPFRDSYQTAYFLSTLMALEDSRVMNVLGCQFKLKWGTALTDTETLSPLIFELGRNGPYQLTATGGNRHFQPGLRLKKRAIGDSLTLRIHPSGPRDRKFFADGYWKSALAGTTAFGLAFAVLSFYLTAARRATFAVYRALTRPAGWVCALARFAWNYVVWLRGLDVHTPLFPLRIKWRLGNLRRATAFLCRITQRHFPTTWADMAILGCGGLLLMLVGVICWDQWNPNGEPFELLAGISVWPSTALRFGVAVASVAFIWKGMRDLALSREQLNDAELYIDRQWLTGRTLLSWKERARRFGLCAAMQDVFAWRWQHKTRHRKKAKSGTGPSISTKMLCRWYFRKGRNGYRLIRITTATLLYIGFAVSLFALTDGWPNNPVRGRLAWGTGMVVLVFTIVSTVALVFFVMDAIQLCSRFIHSLGEETIGWPQEAVARANKARHEQTPEDLRELLIVRVIAHRTNVVAKLLLFPFAVLLLMIASRHPAFDYFTIPVPFMLVLGFLLSGLLVSGLMMRRDASKVRQSVLRRLNENLSVAIGDHQPKRREQLEQLIGEIENERNGAFRPITDDYVFRALAIPFGGAGGLLLMEQLLT